MTRPTGEDEAAGGLQSLELAIRQAQQRLGAHADAIAEQMAGQVQGEVPGFSEEEHPELWSSLRRATSANCRAGLEGFGRPLEPDLVPPGAERELVRQAARAGLSLVSMLAAQRVAERAFWGAALEIFYELDIPSEKREELIARSSMARLDYVHHLASEAAVEFAAERERAGQHEAMERLQIVQDFLSGARPDLSPLQYELDGWHVAAVISDVDPRRALASLTRDLNLRNVSVLREPGIAWAWFGGELKVLNHLRNCAVETTIKASGLRLSLGRPRRESAGLRSSHRQAVNAHRLTTTDAPVVVYDSVAVQLLARYDQVDAREFVVDELGEMASDSSRALRLRETLGAYLSAGHNGASAAAALGIKPRTMTYRLRTIEAELGYTVRSRACELHVALRLHAAQSEGS